MADYIEVNITALEQDTGELRETLKLVRDDMGAMFDTVQELDTMWDGPANEAFNKQFESDRQTLLALCKAVEDILGSMENAQGEYRKCEAGVREEIEKIRI
ncbi:MAG: hypothetical protein HDR14_08740 [Lachnospiraceae bacterium]|nr:hypothetical protein [Lachnospiraceae bacterium]